MIELSIALLGLVLSAVFSAAETAFVSVDRIQLEVRERHGSRGARTALSFLSEPETFLTTTLVGTNISNIAATSFATAVLLQHLSPAAILFTTATILLMFGEIIPKTIAKSWTSQKNSNITNFYQ